MARGPQWLIVDSTRGINQEKWILDHARENLVKFVGPAPEYKTRSSYAQAIAEAFDEHWSRKLPIYNKKAGRMETEDEALLRTGNRPMQAKKWVENNWSKILEGYKAQAVNLLDVHQLDERTRAKSARDFYVAAHPEVRKQVRLDWTGGVEGKFQGAVNMAYSRAIEQAKGRGEFGKYEAIAAAAKVEADALAQQLEGETATVDPAVARASELENLCYTVQTQVDGLTSMTKTAMLVVFGGLDEHGKCRKWMISSTAGAGDDIIPHLKNETNTQILLDRWIRRAAQTSSGVSVVPPDCEVTLRTSSMSSSITSPSENASELPRNVRPADVTHPDMHPANAHPPDGPSFVQPSADARSLDNERLRGAAPIMQHSPGSDMRLPDDPSLVQHSPDACSQNDQTLHAVATPVGGSNLALSHPADAHSADAHPADVHPPNIQSTNGAQSTNAHGPTAAHAPDTHSTDGPPPVQPSESPDAHSLDNERLREAASTVEAQTLALLSPPVVRPSSDTRPHDVPSPDTIPPDVPPLVQRSQDACAQDDQTLHEAVSPIRARTDSVPLGQPSLDELSAGIAGPSPGLLPPRGTSEVPTNTPPDVAPPIVEDSSTSLRRGTRNRRAPTRPDEAIVICQRGPTAGQTGGKKRKNAEVEPSGSDQAAMTTKRSSARVKHMRKP